MMEIQRPQVTNLTCPKDTLYVCHSVCLQGDAIKSPWYVCPKNGNTIELTECTNLSRSENRPEYLSRLSNLSSWLSSRLHFVRFDHGRIFWVQLLHFQPFQNGRSPWSKYIPSKSWFRTPDSVLISLFGENKMLVDVLKKEYPTH